MNLPQYLAWLNNPTLWLTTLAGAVGAVWALSEIIGEFRAETGRALRTSGAWLSAFFIGIAWPTVFRNLTLKLAQPLGEAKDTETAAIRLERAYANVQKLALQLINSMLTRQRARLLAEALRFDLEEIVKFARQMIAISPQQQKPDDKLTWIDSLMERNIDDDAKKTYLVALVMNDFTRGALDDFIKEHKNRRA